MSNDYYWLIWLKGIGIKKNRKESDIAYFNSSDWSGMLQGTDGYPIKKGSNYNIAGGKKHEFFKATAVEFYGVRTQT